MAELAVIIVAAGPGRRMRSFGARSLLTLADGRTVLRRQIDQARAVWPRADIIVVAGFEAERVAKTLPRGVRMVENELYAETGPARSIVMGLRASQADRAAIIYGDLVFTHTFLANIPTDRSVVVVDGAGQFGAAEPGVTIDRGLVSHIGFGLFPKWVPITILGPHECDLYRQIGGIKSVRGMLGFEPINMVIDRGGEFSAYLPEDLRIVEIDAIDDVVLANQRCGISVEATCEFLPTGIREKDGLGRQGILATTASS